MFSSLYDNFTMERSKIYMMGEREDGHGAIQRVQRNIMWNKRKNYTKETYISFKWGLGFCLIDMFLVYIIFVIPRFWHERTIYSWWTCEWNLHHQGMTSSLMTAFYNLRDNSSTRSSSFRGDLPGNDVHVFDVQNSRKVIKLIWANCVRIRIRWVNYYSR